MRRLSCCTYAQSPRLAIVGQILLLNDREQETIPRRSGSQNMSQKILLAGATGNLGGHIARALIARDAHVRAIVRPSSDSTKIAALLQLGIEVVQCEMNDAKGLRKACEGVDCVVSALAGLREVIIDAQKLLLDAAVAANVPRFIPSDFSLDFTKTVAGRNRNLDLRREFHIYLDQQPIQATTIFNGAFADMLTGEMPLILFKRKRILYWGNADLRMDMTTVADTAAYTAAAALDASTPRYLRIAGIQESPRTLAGIMRVVTGQEHRLFRAGGVGLLSFIISIARTVAPGKKELYPAWQGMQYMRDMVEGHARMQQTDNNRYPGLRWTSVAEIVGPFLANGGGK
jgi:NAD(P)-dependent dehydrogenase (short-subunit alcohol dehydrogenase family)